MKIGIYGGTFDPPHLGHMEAACAAVGHFGLDKLFLIPSREPPHKFLPAESAKPLQRRDMTRIMADGVGEKAQVLDLELLREGGPSYTVDTVRSLRKDYPDATFYLLMGTDMFFSFETWQSPRELAAEATLVAFSREKTGAHELFAVQSEQLRESLGARIEILPLPKIYPISSTQVRRLLRDEETIAEGGALLWEAVYGYILKYGLYGVQADLRKLTDDQLRAVSFSMIRTKRVPHVRGVEETAVLLAERWGEDVRLARRAAILHDCTKYWSLEEHLALCDQHNIPLTAMERGSAKLMHAKSGAAMAQYVFEEPEVVSRAIDCHTTGKAHMTVLDKILYVADYVEPNRSFEGVEAIRKLAWEDLDKAMLLGLETTMEELRAKGAQLDENTRQAYLQLKGHDPCKESD